MDALLEQGPSRDQDHLHSEWSYKRLDAGTFASLWVSDDGKQIELTVNELSLLLEGCSVVGRIALSPPTIDVASASRVAPVSFR